MSSIISSIYTDSCYILSKGDRINNFGEYEWSISDAYDCLFIDKEGMKIRDNTGELIIITGFIILDTKPKEDDELVYDDYLYKIMRIIIEKDPLTGTADHYKIAVIRRRPYAEQPIRID